MKKILILVFLTVFSVNLLAQTKQIDPRKKPLAGDRKEIVVPKYEQFTLENGMKVILLEDNELPWVEMQMLISGGKLSELKDDAASLSGTLMSRGAGKRNSQELADFTDGIGASLSTGSSTEYNYISASGLSKHKNTLLELIADVAKNPKYDKKDFESEVKKMMVGLQSRKSSTGALMGDMTRMIVYGKDNDIAKRTTAETLKNLSIDDIKQYHKDNVFPQNAILALVGNFKSADMKKSIEKLFGTWENITKTLKPASQLKPMPRGIYFVERPGSVQSSIRFVIPTVNYNHDDYEAIDFATRYFSSGFAGRLFKTLREQYSYTYSPSSAHTSNRFLNYFTCGADVRNDVTDSAITVLLEQIKDLNQNAPSEDETTIIKNFNIGNWELSLENSSNVLNIIAMAEFRGKTFEAVMQRAKNIQSFQSNAMKNIANKYLNADKGYIVIVGNSSVKSKLEKFGLPIYSYNSELELLGYDKNFKSDAKDVYQKFQKALGGLDKIATIKNYKSEGTQQISAGGHNMSINFVEYKMQPNKYSQKGVFMGMEQAVWLDGDKGWTMQSGRSKEMSEQELNQYKIDAPILREAFLDKENYLMKSEGKLNNLIIIKFYKMNGDDISEEMYAYFDENNGLLKTLEFSKVFNGVSTIFTKHFDKYETYQDVMLPTEYRIESNLANVKVSQKYQVNIEIDENNFKPSQN